jgi:hypothetical protein
MRMSVLGHSTTVHRSTRQNVAFDDGDHTKEVGKHTGGEKAAHARAEDNCSVTTFGHLIPLLAILIGERDHGAAVPWLFDDGDFLIWIDGSHETFPNA